MEVSTRTNGSGELAEACLNAQATGDFLQDTRKGLDP
jgi:hypothetical protein